jgi:thiosulfate/3-mercaptopyruvate sulfurtransferase
MAPFTTLIDAATLSRQLGRDDLVVFDCRFELGNPQWGEREYAAAHLPGAFYLHLDRDLSSPIGAGTGRHPLPDAHEFARTLGARGVGADCQLIAYDQGNGVYAARLWWMARWIGLRNVAVLDGGLAAWRAAGSR